MRTIGPRSILQCVFGWLLLTAASSWVTAADLDSQVAFDIPAQSLDAALLQLSKQASIQLVISSGSVILVKVIATPK